MKRRELLKFVGVLAGSRIGLAAGPGALGSVGTVPTGQAPDFLSNQLGFLPHEAKTVSVRGGEAEAKSFRLVSLDGKREVFAGELSGAALDAASGDTLRQAVFSKFRRPGRYRLEVGGHRSEPISIGYGVYRQALRTTMRGYYGQRCGCAVDLGAGYRHDACHANGVYGATSGKTGSLPNHGGWHDAGDYGRYVVNCGITCGTLLYAWEMFPLALRRLKLDIPESGGKTPDFLAEVRWNLEWMLQLQDDDGGVFHKQTSAAFCAFIMPEKDTLVSEVIGTGSAPYKSTCATADFAAVMSVASRCFADYDLVFAERCRNAARQAWTWATANPSVTYRNPPGITTGAYGDRDCSDELMWASAELWRTTGEAKYEEGFLTRLPKNLEELAIGVPSWASVGALACWTYARAPWHGDAEVKAAVRKATVVAADALVAKGRENGYGNTMKMEDYGWGSNSAAANQSLLLCMAEEFAPGDADRVEAALNNMHYLLGRNCHDVSWVTQVGRRPFMNPHHRPSVADGIEKPWPGLLSGGPNRRPGDAVARKLPVQPPMRMWVDEYPAYSLNEIAINWNAPLVFLLAFANERAGRAARGRVRRKSPST